ncbi:MAG TPA: phosphopantetheine-binding protein [Patescibacteria group bacterium]|nr:phosphopantetheine-binding protein [Patescibacteria group bacterium]
MNSTRLADKKLTAAEIQKIVIAKVCQYRDLTPQQIDLEAELCRGLGLDSLDITELSIQLEEEIPGLNFESDKTSDDFDRLYAATVKSLVEFICEKLDIPTS